MKVKKYLLFVLVCIMVISYSYNVSASGLDIENTEEVKVFDSIEEFSETVDDLQEEYDIKCEEQDSEYATKRLMVWGNYNGDNYGAVSAICYGSIYTILQYISVEETEYAFKQISKEVGIENIEVDKEIEITEEQIEGGNYADKEVMNILGLSDMQNKLECQSKNVTVGIIDSGFKEDKVTDTFNRVTSYSNNVTDLNTISDHGTLVSGLILDATPNNVKLNIKGISKGLRNGSDIIYSSDLENALASFMDEDGKANVDVINISLVTKSSEVSDEDQFSIVKNTIDKLQENNVPIVVSAGNGDDEGYGTDINNYFPACYEPVITVGSVDRGLELSEFSNYGEGLDFVSIGENIKILDTIGNYGTSFSAPIITSFIANMKGYNKNLSFDEIYNELISMCFDLGDEGKDIKYGNGIPIYNYGIPVQGYELCARMGNTHNYITTRTEATCSSPVNITKICKICSIKTSETEGKPLGHDFSVLVSETEATCEKASYKTFKCSRCLTENIEQISNSLGHTYKVLERMDATCTHEGHTDYKCDRCGDEYTSTENKNMNNHVGSGVRIEHIPPSCGVDGYNYYYCEGCGKWINTTIIPYLLHNYGEIIERKEPTEMADGYIKYRCTNGCGSIKTVVLKATGGGSGGTTENPPNKEDNTTEENKKDNTTNERSDGSTFKNIKVPTFSWKSSCKQIKSLKKGTLKIKVKKSSGCYLQVYLATNSKFTKNKKSVTIIGSTKTIKGLKKGKTYYVKVRYVKKVGTRRFYGKWSTKKKVKIKK